MILTAIVVFIGSFACLLMLIFSLSIGFGFFVVPILIAEVMLLVAVYLMRRAFTRKKSFEPEAPVAWYAQRGAPPPRRLDRLDDRYAQPYGRGTVAPEPVESSGFDDGPA